MTSNASYKCNECGFEWRSPKKEYKNCPDCKSEDICTIDLGEDLEVPRLGQGMGRGRIGVRSGPPRCVNVMNVVMNPQKPLEYPVGMINVQNVVAYFVVLTNAN